MLNTRGVAQLTSDAPIDLRELETALQTQQENIKARYLHRNFLHRQDTATGNTPLHLAARALEVGLVLALLQSGANPNIQNKAGDTPLALALETGKSAPATEIVEALLKHAADPTLYRYQHSSPLALAILQDDGPMVQRLLPAYENKMPNDPMRYQYWVFLATFTGVIRQCALTALKKTGASLSILRNELSLFDSVGLNSRINAQLNGFKAELLAATLSRYEFLLAHEACIGDLEGKTVLKNLEVVYWNCPERAAFQTQYESTREWLIKRIEQQLKP